jgi:hypothetical protein
VPGRRRQRATDRSKLDATPPWDTRTRDEPPPTTGPYDVRDAPDDGVARVDLGAVRIPVGEHYNIRLDVSNNQQVVSATLTSPIGSMQVGVFAAPRNEGIWDEVRAEIAESMTGQRKSASREVAGPFGPELHGRLPAGEGGNIVPVRFIGVDGPRWFLRALIAGPVAAEPEKSGVFEDALRKIVVVRGNEPLPVREPVPFQLPNDLDLPTQG